MACVRYEVNPAGKRRERLPADVALAWHGVNDDLNLYEFLSSPVRWGEIDVRRDPEGSIVLRHDSFDLAPASDRERLMRFAAVVDAFAEHDRNLKVDLKEGLGLLDDIVAILRRRRFPGERLWFNGRIEVIGSGGIAALRLEFPDAIVQCPVDFLAPLVVAAPARARGVLRLLSSWGVSRFSVAWGEEFTRLLVERCHAWRHEVNVYAVPDFESFLLALALAPTSLTADFNFPELNYYGRGSGAQHRYHQGRTGACAVDETGAACATSAGSER